MPRPLNTAPKLPSDNGSKKRHVLHCTRDLCPSARLAKSGRAASLKGAARASSGRFDKENSIYGNTSSTQDECLSRWWQCRAGRAASGVEAWHEGHDCFFSQRTWRAWRHVRKRRPIPCCRVLQITRRGRDMHCQLVGDILGTVAVIRSWFYIKCRVSWIKSLIR
jgi:hypothetical protein